MAVLTGITQAAPRSRAATQKTVLSDQELERAIRERLATSKCAADKFIVRVQGGVVTLEGHTDVVQRKGAATRMAKSAGAKKVVNRIQISDAARQRVSKNLAQGRRRVQVKRSEAVRK